MFTPFVAEIHQSGCLLNAIPFDSLHHYRSISLPVHAHCKLAVFAPSGVVPSVFPKISHIPFGEHRLYNKPVFDDS